MHDENIYTILYYQLKCLIMFSAGSTCISVILLSGNKPQDIPNPVRYAQQFKEESAGILMFSLYAWFISFYVNYIRKKNMYSKSTCK